MKLLTLGLINPYNARKTSNESENIIMWHAFMGVQNSTEHCSIKCPGGHFQSWGVRDVMKVT